MKKLLLIMIISIPLLFSCQSSVRFTSSNKEYSKEANKKEQKEYRNTRSNSIIEEAEKWMGTPYCYGGNTKSCTDCSGFVKEVYSNFGIELPRTAAEQYEFCKSIPDSKKEPGDLVFFKDKNKIFHVGIYASNNEFIHASSSMGVIRQSLDLDYYRKHLCGFGRVVDNNN